MNDESLFDGCAETCLCNPAIGRMIVSTPTAQPIQGPYGYEGPSKLPRQSASLKI
jgi:hypothetical protein